MDQTIYQLLAALQTDSVRVCFDRGEWSVTAEPRHVAACHVVTGYGATVEDAFMSALRFYADARAAYDGEG